MPFYDILEILAENQFQQLVSEKNLQKKRKKLIDYLFYREWESEFVYVKVGEILK
ncbi:MAG: hypothetical protein Q8O62_03855 [Aequorivita sp.]|nr:hypothetical protein [Aequorivita sp.]